MKLPDALLLVVPVHFQAATAFFLQPPTKWDPSRQVLLQKVPLASTCNTCNSWSRKGDPWYRRFESPLCVTSSSQEEREPPEASGRQSDSNDDGATDAVDAADAANARSRRSEPVYEFYKDEDDRRTTTRGSNNSPDRAISIVSELKANAALFAAFAFGSLNLPSALTVSESKVTSVTTSLSISRPLPDSDLIRSFVVLDVCTLCLMISCVAASQLLIYRLTDGSYEEYGYDDTYYDDDYDYASRQIQDELLQQQPPKKDPWPREGARRPHLRRRNRDSALGTLVTRYRDEFTVARLTFDLGLMTLLLAVGVRTVTIFDQDIAVPVTAVIGTTAAFLVTAYLTSYVEVFRRVDDSEAEEKKKWKELQQQQQQRTGGSTTGSVATKGPFRRIVLPLTVASFLGVGLYWIITMSDGGIHLSRIGPYGFTAGESKLRVVTEKVAAEKGKLESLGRKKLKEQKSKKINSSISNKNQNKSREKSALDKMEAEKATAAAAEKAAAEKAAIEKVAVAEKAAADKVVAAEKAIAEKVTSSVEKTPKPVAEKAVVVEKVAATDKTRSVESH